MYFRSSFPGQPLGAPPNLVFKTPQIHLETSIRLNENGRVMSLEMTSNNHPVASQAHLDSYVVDVIVDVVVVVM